MAQTSWPFDAGPGAIVRESEWQKLARAFLRTGVVTGALGQLSVTSDGSGMSVSVASGQAQVEGFFFESDAALALTIAVANATNPRIDTVVARLDRAANSITLAVVAGTPAATPARPVLSATDALHEMPLADVRVDAAVGVIAAGKVTDRRTFARNLAATQTGLRNRVHNGDFRVNERGYVSGTALAVGAYCFDRWKAGVASTTLTFTFAPNGQTVTIADTKWITQVVERFDMPAGTYVLSWAGTATGRAYNSGAAAPAFAAGPIVVDLDGLADVVVELAAAGGAQTAGLVQLEQVAASGTVADATLFERRPIDMERGLCRRFFERLTFAAGQHVGVGAYYSATDVYFGVTYAPKRAAPSRVLPAAGTVMVLSNGVERAGTAISATSTPTPTRMEVVVTTAAATSGHGAFLRAASAQTAVFDIIADL